MKFFNRYIEENNFRWIGFHIRRITFGFGFSFGKPLWMFPTLIFAINEPDYRYFTKRLFDLSFGWLLFSFRIQILKGTY